MVVYIALLAGCVLAGIPLCSSKCGKWGKAVYCAAAALAFVLITALRFEVGYDYLSYAGTFSRMKYWDIEDILSNRMEKGFLLPLYILSLGFESYQTVFVYTAIVFYPAIFYLIYKYSSNPWISTAAFLCLGIFFNSLCFLRQFISAIIILYAIKYVGENRPVRFIVLVIAAATFHWSALVMIVMYVFLKIKPGYIYLGVAVAGTILFCIFSRTAMLWVIENVPMYSSYNPESNVEASTGLPVMYTIMFGIPFILSFIFRKPLMEKNANNSIYINCLMFTTIFEAMGTRHGILSRFALLVYLPPVLYLIPDLVMVIKEYIDSKLENGSKKVILNVASAAVGAISAVACYVLLISNNYNGVAPYVSIFNKPHEIFEETVIEDPESDMSFSEEWYTEESDEVYEDEEWAEEDWDDEYWEEDEESIEEMNEALLEQLG